jgi:hypothetical protein
VAYTVDVDGDGLFDYEESSILDSDGDGVADQDDTENANSCVPDPAFCPPEVPAMTPIHQGLLGLLLASTGALLLGRLRRRE